MYTYTLFETKRLETIHLNKRSSVKHWHLKKKTSSSTEISLPLSLLTGNLWILCEVSNMSFGTIGYLPMASRRAFSSARTSIGSPESENQNFGVFTNPCVYWRSFFFFTVHITLYPLAPWRRSTWQFNMFFSGSCFPSHYMDYYFLRSDWKIVPICLLVCR